MQLFFENGKPVALLETNDIENDTILFIYQFEVVNKGNGIGYRIVHELKQIFQLIQLYPQTEKAKHFWEKCGFIAEDEGNGIILMEFSKS